MLLHERIEEEMEIMLFMLDQEYDISSNITNNEKFDTIVERSLDYQIYQKYINFATLQATMKSYEYCDKRIRELDKEDRSLLEYASFLHSKIKDYNMLLE